VGKLYFCLIISFLLFVCWEKLLSFGRACSYVAVLNHYCLSHMVCFGFEKFFVVFLITVVWWMLSGYYQGPPVMAPPQYGAPPPRREAGFLEGW
jgi:hypothetical protein